MNSTPQPITSEYDRKRWLEEAAVQGVAALAWKSLGYPELAGVSATRAAHYAFLAQPDFRNQVEAID